MNEFVNFKWDEKQKYFSICLAVGLDKELKPPVGIFIQILTQK